jgi:hypothetical protein
MVLRKHTRTSHGTYRRERADSLVKNLKKEYPEFEQINGNTKLGTLKDRLGVDSLNKVREALREKNKR